MRKILFGMVGAAALAMSSVASATITLDSCSMSCTGPSTNGNTTTIGYSEAGLTSPNFLEYLVFTNSLNGLYSVTLSTSSAGVDFTSAFLWDGVNEYDLSLGFDDGTNEFWSLPTTGLAAGQYGLYIFGDNNDTGTLGGTVTIRAVPEPATWAMMLLGFGAIGWQLRRRRNSLALAQAA